MTTGKGIAVGGGLLALAVLFSGGDEPQASSVTTPANYRQTETQQPATKIPIILDDYDIEPEPESTGYIPVTERNIVPVTQSTPRTSGYSCSCSKTCTQMSSCREAYFQLNSCGCSRRDGDGDGVPCESIC